MELIRKSWETVHRRQTRDVHRRLPHSKVRSGCSNCKRRRVKCDEAKPVCNRCTTSGLQCPGYEAPKDKSPKKSQILPAAIRSLQPANVQRQVVRIYNRPAFPGPARSLSPVSLTSIDVVYFDMFRHHILPDIKMWCQNFGFDQYLIYEFMQEESVRLAILGLTAMTKATQLSYEQLAGKLNISKAHDLISNDYVSGLHIDHYHRSQALKHYSDALSICRRQSLLADCSKAHRPTIISTLMFVILEVLQGNFESSGKLLLSTLTLLKRGTGWRGASLSGSRKRLSESDEATAKLDDMFYHLYIKCPQYIWTEKREDMSGQIQTNELPTLPAEVISVEFLRMHWERTTRLVKRFSMSLNIKTHPTQYEWQQCILIAHIHQWKPLLRRHSRTRDIRSRLDLHVLEVEILVTLVYLECCLDPTDQLWDGKTKQYREIVGVLEKLAKDMENSSVHTNFMFDFWLMLPLTVVVTQCRDLVMRQKVLDLLARVICHGARWNSIAWLKGLQAIVDIEENGRDESGLIPHSSRYDWIGSKWDFERFMFIMEIRPMTWRISNSPVPAKQIPIHF